MPSERDTAIVLSGGGVNGVLMEQGFLARVQESRLWERVGWIFGTSSGALAGTMAALDRLDDLEEFLLALRPEEAFRQNSIWRLLLQGSHDYTLPGTVAARLGEPVDLMRELAGRPVEVVVLVTDIGGADDGEGLHAHELAFSSRDTPPEIFAEAVLASSAISGLVMPRRVGTRLGTDGGWVRNFPLGLAYDRPEVRALVSFRYVPRYPPIGAAHLRPLRRRLQPLRRLPPVSTLLAELDEAEEREARGEPAHLVELILRLMRVTITRNTVLEVERAREKDEALAALAALRADLPAIVAAEVGDPAARARLEQALGDRVDAARFPFRNERLLTHVAVEGTAEEPVEAARFGESRGWSQEAKLRLIAQGRRLADDALRRHDMA